MQRDLLAWCQFPEPQGTPYGQRDLADPAKVAQLLDRAQVHRAWIAREGWEALWRLYGLQGLLDLNRHGGWFDTESDKAAAEEIRHRSLVAGYDPGTIAELTPIYAREVGLFALAGDG
jgi:hypothetical protein